MLAPIAHNLLPAAAADPATDDDLLRRYAAADAAALTELIRRHARLQPGQIAGDPTLLQQSLSGDWIIRPGAKPNQLVRDWADAIAHAMGQEIKVTRKLLDQNVIVATGLARAPKSAGNDTTLHIHLQPDATGQSGGMGPVRQFLAALTENTGLTFVDETASRPGQAGMVAFDISGTLTNTPLTDLQRDDLLKSLHAETSLIFHPDTRAMDVWTLETVGKK